jgi:hypothetical protein
MTRPGDTWIGDWLGLVAIVLALAIALLTACSAPLRRVTLDAYVGCARSSAIAAALIHAAGGWTAHEEEAASPRFIAFMESLRRRLPRAVLIDGTANSSPGAFLRVPTGRKELG